MYHLPARCRLCTTSLSLLKSHIPKLSSFLQPRCSVWQVLEKLVALYCLAGIWSIIWARYPFSSNPSDGNLSSDAKILCLELDKAEPMNCPLCTDIDADHATVQDTIS